LERLLWGGGAAFFVFGCFLSVIWVAASVYFEEPKTYAWVWRAPVVEIESPSGHKVVFDSSKGREALTAEVTAILQREARGRSDIIQLSDADLFKAIGRKPSIDDLIPPQGKAAPAGQALASRLRARQGTR
jgi:hypothetical protein